MIGGNPLGIYYVLQFYIPLAIPHVDAFLAQYESPIKNFDPFGMALMGSDYDAGLYSTGFRRG